MATNKEFICNRGVRYTSASNGYYIPNSDDNGGCSLRDAVALDSFTGGGRYICTCLTGLTRGGRVHNSILLIASSDFGDRHSRIVDDTELRLRSYSGLCHQHGALHFTSLLALTLALWYPIIYRDLLSKSASTGASLGSYHLCMYIRWCQAWHVPPSYEEASGPMFNTRFVAAAAVYVYVSLCTTPR